MEGEWRVSGKGDSASIVREVGEWRGRQCASIVRGEWVS